ncbi:MAG: NADPH:quinone oxidoreductase family protein [Alphaproteobacteria bacterium]|nr:NADPH:quinone oxidoreductase family protein [Alphaproteobacteria bacterium]
MRAVLCREYCTPAELDWAETDDPVPGPGEVVVDVAACGVNFADTLIIQGKYQEKPPFPFSPGLEVGGIVAAVGDGVDKLAPGDRVLAIPPSGGYAEKVKAPASLTYKIPDAMPFDIAAGFPVTYGTAHGALIWRARAQEGETCAIHGAAGGVGLASIEVAKAMGLTVIGTAGGPEKCKTALDYGADHAIDYRSEDLKTRLKELTGGTGADIYLDMVGGDAFDASLRAIAWDGRIVIIGFAGGTVPKPPANILLVKNCSVIGFYWGSYARKRPDLFDSQMADLFRWFEEGKLTSTIHHHIPMPEAAKALDLLTTRKATGKVVLTTDLFSAA